MGTLPFDSLINSQCLQSYTRSVCFDEAAADLCSALRYKDGQSTCVWHSPVRSRRVLIRAASTFISGPAPATNSGHYLPFQCHFNLCDFTYNKRCTRSMEEDV